MWVICIGCHRAVDVKPLRKNARLRCSACGSTATRNVRVLKPNMLNGGQMPAALARRTTWAGLRSIALHRGYKAGWVGNKYKAIFGRWPEGEQPEPDNPSGEVLWWIRKGNKAFAQERAALEGDKPVVVEQEHPSVGSNVPRAEEKVIPSPLPITAISPLMTDEDWATSL